jgi:hypothetical protein
MFSIKYLTTPAKVIANYFNKFVEKKKMPPLAMCRELLKKNKLSSDKSTKNIQDKVKNLYKYKS